MLKANIFNQKEKEPMGDRENRLVSRNFSCKFFAGNLQLSQFKSPTFHASARD